MKKLDKLKQTAEKLFSEQGLKKVSIDEICHQANVSRVTFYKYFPNKKALIKTLFTEQKNIIRQQFILLLAQQTDLKTIIERILSLQQQALSGLYSQAVLVDLQTLEPDLVAFFNEMEKEKYAFMHDFFLQLQQRGIIASDIPIILVDMLIKTLDVFAKKPELIDYYAGNEPQLFQDLLRLFLYGISHPNRSNK